MNLINVKRKLLNYYINSRGWKTKRRIIVIQSDDWGSIRTPTEKVLQTLKKEGFPVEKNPYIRFDALESNEDLRSLINTLKQFKDFKGRHPIVTANIIVTNPNFYEIKKAGYSKYFYEPFTETLRRFPNRDQVINLYHEGINQGVLHPQLHGFTHVNITRWLKSLKEGNKITRRLFELGMYDLSDSQTQISENSFVDALNVENLEDLSRQQKELETASQIFEEIFGYKSATFIAPCYTWRPELEKKLSDLKIKSIQTGVFQSIPLFKKENQFKKKIHYTGKTNKYKTTYLVRNCFFEPSLNEKAFTIESCLKQIQNAFKNQKPAIISSHRLNFIGFIDEKNRINNLILLKNLLSLILKKWPDVEFMNSVELGSLILNESI